jgi:hypothetical protein
MNTGLQDAYNLGWKLALVVAGGAREALLDSYAVAREPVAERLLATTDRLFSFVVSDHWVSRMLRTRVIARIPAVALRFDAARKFAFGLISQIGIRYPWSPLSQTHPGLPDGAPRAGDRFPWLRLVFTSGAPAEDLFARLDDTRFNLILIGGSHAAVPADQRVVHSRDPGPGDQQRRSGAGGNPRTQLLLAAAGRPHRACRCPATERGRAAVFLRARRDRSAERARQGLIGPAQIDVGQQVRTSSVSRASRKGGFMCASDPACAAPRALFV